MKSWSILFEASYSILFLTLAYLLLNIYFVQDHMPVSLSMYEIQSLIDIGRQLNTNCNLNSDYAYIYTDLSTGGSTICYYGKQLTTIQGKKMFSYLYYDGGQDKFYIITFLK